MKTKQQLNACRTSLEDRRIDETLVAHTHARLLARLELGEGATWQEVIEAPLPAVWEATADGAHGPYRHLPDVREITTIESSARQRYHVVRDLAGVVEHRIGEVLVEVPRSMLCASDLDASDVSTAGALPTIYSISMHEHATNRDWTVVVLAGTTLGVYNPWILPSLGHQCASIRVAVEMALHRGLRIVRATPERRIERAAVAGAAAR
jgi:hypothetical protein